MIHFIMTIMSLMAVWLFTGFDWFGDLFTAHNLANIALVILGIIIASATSQLRLVLEKVENILSVYAKYTHPDSEDGKKLSEAERQRLFDLFLRELGSLVQEFGTGIFARVGKGIQTAFKAVGLRL